MPRKRPFMGILEQRLAGEKAAQAHLRDLDEDAITLLHDLHEEAFSAVELDRRVETAGRPMSVRIGDCSAHAWLGIPRPVMGAVYGRPREPPRTARPMFPLRGCGRARRKP